MTAISRDQSQRYQEKHKHIRGRGLIASSALGLSDGLITNLAFLTGFAGGISDVGLIRFAGLAAMLAGAVSMLFGGILGARSEEDLYNADSKREAYEIEHEPNEEFLELKNIYKGKGLSEAEANAVVEKISRDKQKFLEDMLVNELHIHRSSLENPLRIGIVTGLSFLVGAGVPLAPYFATLDRTTAVEASILLSSIFLFAVGAWKGRVAGTRAWRTGLEMLGLGILAAGILYLIGRAFVFV